MAGCKKISSEALVKPPKEILVYEAAKVPNGSQSGLKLQRNRFINPAPEAVKNKFPYRIKIHPASACLPPESRRNIGQKSPLPLGKGFPDAPFQKTGIPQDPSMAKEGSGSFFFFAISRQPS
jgi:hypothetical protein